MKDWLRRAVSASAARAVVVLAALAWLAAPAAADIATRTSAFEYDAASGLLVKEIVEPGNPDLCVVTTHQYDPYGNKTGSTTRNCNGSAGTSPGVNSEAPAPTGLAVFDTGERFTTFGQLVILTCIQIGGLGLMTFTTVLCWTLIPVTADVPRLSMNINNKNVLKRENTNNSPQNGLKIKTPADCSTNFRKQHCMRV